MNNIYYCKIYKDRSGLCNQLFSLITGIIIAYKTGKKTIIVDDFLNDYSKKETSLFSQLFDIDKLNTFLKENYDIYIFDKNKIHFQVQEVKYGIHNQTIDITNEIIHNYCSNNSLFIDTNVNLNVLVKVDPAPNMLKKLYIKYLINNILFEEEYDEKYCFLTNQIMFDLSKAIFQYEFGWIKTHYQPIFENILNHLYVTPYISEHVDRFIQTNHIDTTKKINVIHLRLEEDAINHWSKMNNMTPIMFHTFLSVKYIQIIKKYIDKSDQNIILSYSTDNHVVSYLKKNNYKCYFTDKTNIGREINALIDLNIGKICNNLFIGNFNMEQLNGSTLSFCLINHFNKKVKLALIDLDNVRQCEKIYF